MIYLQTWPNYSCRDVRCKCHWPMYSTSNDQCPAAFDTGNDVATIAHRTLENLLTRRSPWSAEVKALQINSWAARLNFIEDLMKAYDDLLDLDADEAVSESIDAFADKLSKVTHKISHDILVINMERVHDATASATVATQDALPSALQHVQYITGEMMAGAAITTLLSPPISCFFKSIDLMLVDGWVPTAKVV